MAGDLERTERTTIHRLHARGSYDRDTIFSILDEARLCHVSVVGDPSGRVVPRGFGRRGDELIFHGSATCGFFRALLAGAEACVCVTLLDGIVCARSAFAHSMNYRSVVLFGRATELVEREAKVDGLRAFLEHQVPGRSADCRPPSDAELAITTVLAFPITEGSAKLRTGPPGDKASDVALDVWAGEIPLRVVPGAPVDAPGLRPGLEAPSYLRPLRRPGAPE